MNILVIGNGGREHALAWKAAQSDRVDVVYVAPGNAGTAHEPGMKNIPIAVNDFDGLANFAEKNKLGLTIVGPEVPLVAGIVDYFQSRDLPIFGPTRAGAQLEGSKSFSKDFLARHSIPTADYQVFTEIGPAIAYVEKTGAPIVVKADGLAAGKGVIVAQTNEEAIHAIKDMLAGNAFGEAGHRVVVEEFLPGEEASFIVMADGEHILPLATSQDHKARDEGDKGPNTGGMGAYSPAPVVTAGVYERIMNEVIRPTIKGMASEGYPYSGFLYAGIMVAPDGTLKVLEFNCRFGDPETQPVMLRLKSDLVELCLAAIEKRLDQVAAEWDPRASLGVVLAAGGYPGTYNSGDVISGLPSQDDTDKKVFHAGTAEKNGHIVTAGGRVLCAVALGKDVTEAQKNAYQLASQIEWNRVFCRKDIGYRAVEREARIPTDG
ncbi:MAG TPA: phosphoribosylamine--glycine ligase [Gammaproteobacteria bacterium]|nr:phosphoribosylamine--glycine ligase [Gammaproteobacteria bacterium]